MRFTKLSLHFLRGRFFRALHCTNKFRRRGEKTEQITKQTNTRANHSGGEREGNDTAVSHPINYMNRTKKSYIVRLPLLSQTRKEAGSLASAPSNAPRLQVGIGKFNLEAGVKLGDKVLSDAGVAPVNEVVEGM